MTRSLPSILITRPEKDAQSLRNLLEEHGFHGLVEPLLKMEISPSPPPLLVDMESRSKYDGILVTSKNAIRALEQWEMPEDLPIYTLYHTADFARSLGFHRAKGIGANALELLQRLPAEFAHGSPYLLYLRGEDVSRELGNELAAEGIGCDEATVYRAAASTAFSDDCLHWFHTGMIQGVTLLSARTAAIFIRLVRQHHLTHLLAQVDLYAFSPYVKEMAEALAPRSVHILPSPDIASLLTELKQQYKKF